jgi:ubiquinone/menaquinone biosynthesis C-methylase UbiE
MNIKEAYQIWSEQYDTNDNKTRDLESVALQATLSNIKFDKVIEFGCGTGKNTVWLEQKAKQLLGVDFSEAMISQAINKSTAPNTKFILADINEPWSFTNEQYDLVTYSLVLEHIEDLDTIFKKACQITTEHAYLYMSELHPFKQYAGSKARFTTEAGEQIVTCFTHNISDFLNAAKKYNFELKLLEEWFDNDDKTNIPRILTLLFQKK